MASAFARAGIVARSFQIDDDPRDDVLLPATRRWLRWEVESGRLGMIWMVLPCSSWSRARRNTTGRPGWPRPLRGAGAVWGLPDLSAKEREHVLNANKQAHFMIGLFALCLRNNVTMVVENPRGSWIWRLPSVQRLASRAEVELVDFDMCAFHAPWRTATRVMMCHGDAHLFSACKCKNAGGVCSFSQRPDIRLSGADGRRFKTHAAQTYPVDLCQRFACTARRRC